MTTETFGPNDSITREQLATVLYRYAQFKHLDVSAKGDLSSFTDQPDGWAADAVGWAVGEHLIEGKSHSVLDPRGKATRAEVATILMRFLSGLGYAHSIWLGRVYRNFTKA